MFIFIFPFCFYIILPIKLCYSIFLFIDIYEIFYNILGTKIINPTIADVIADITTAPAAISLASFAFSFLLGIAISTVVSIAVFINSVVITKPNKIIQTIHSACDILKAIPAIITNITTIKCIFKFCSVFRADNIPSKAYLKLFTNFFLLLPFLIHKYFSPFHFSFHHFVFVIWI